VPSDTRNAIRIQTKSADHIFDRYQIDRIDLVKIDAEGHEKPIIAACLPHFDRLQPKVILFEDAGGDAAAIAAALSQIGYKTFGIKKSLTSLALVDGAEHGSHDYVAVSKARSIPDRARRLYGI